MMSFLASLLKMMKAGKLMMLVGQGRLRLKFLKLLVLNQTHVRARSADSNRFGYPIWLSFQHTVHETIKVDCSQAGT